MILSDYKLSQVDGTPIDWFSFDDQLILFCNIARFCGLSIQMQELSKLQDMFASKLTIIASPCNQFMFQEPGTKKHICRIYDKPTSFIITEKIKVNGPHTHPLYRELKRCAVSKNRHFPQLLAPLSRHIIYWNFTKFLITQDRQTVYRFSPATTPMALIKTIETLLHNREAH